MQNFLKFPLFFAKSLPFCRKFATFSPFLIISSSPRDNFFFPRATFPPQSNIPSPEQHCLPRATSLPQSNSPKQHCLPRAIFPPQSNSPEQHCLRATFPPPEQLPSPEQLSLPRATFPPQSNFPSPEQHCRQSKLNSHAFLLGAK